MDALPILNTLPLKTDFEN